MAGDQDDGSLSQVKNFQNEGTRSKNPNRQEPWASCWTGRGSEGKNGPQGRARPSIWRGPPEEPEAEKLVSAPEGRPVSREDPVLWPSSFGTGKAEASMRTSPSSQGPNIPGCALWQD